MKWTKGSKLGISDDGLLACCHRRLLEQLVSLLLKCLGTHAHLYLSQHWVHPVLFLNTGVPEELKADNLLLSFHHLSFLGAVNSTSAVLSFVPVKRRETGGRWPSRWPVWLPSVVSSSLGSRRTTVWPAAAGSSAGPQTVDEDKQEYTEVKPGINSRRSAQLMVSWSVFRQS